jgi:hypothetical protein
MVNPDDFNRAWIDGRRGWADAGLPESRRGGGGGIPIVRPIGTMVCEAGMGCRVSIQDRKTDRRSGAPLRRTLT